LLRSRLSGRRKGTVGVADRLNDRAGRDRAPRCGPLTTGPQKNQTRGLQLPGLAVGRSGRHTSAATLYVIFMMLYAQRPADVSIETSDCGTFHTLLCTGLPIC